MIKKQAIALLSGGLDSAVALWWAIKNGWRCSALSFDYGQRHHRELKSARRLAQAAGVPHQILRFKLPWSGSSLTQRNERLPEGELNQIKSERLPSTYVPARNTLFLSFALSWADEKEAEGIVIGANAIDYSGYPDCRPAYLKAFERVAALGSRTGTEHHRRIRIVAPLVRLSKADIVKLGQKLKVPLELTWSCYKGGAWPCGRCDSCVLRARGFAEAGVEDESRH